MDTVSPIERSRIMASVKSDGNKSTEVQIADLFRKTKITGWRRHYPLCGKPDFVFPKKQIALFVDGCFWHGCPQHCRIPHTHRRYWVKKIASNKQRDARITRRLRSKGWFVVRIWEHEIKTGAVLARVWRIKEAL